MGGFLFLKIEDFEDELDIFQELKDRELDYEIVQRNGFNIKINTRNEEAFASNDFLARLMAESKDYLLI